MITARARCILIAGFLLLPRLVVAQPEPAQTEQPPETSAAVQALQKRIEALEKSMAERKVAEAKALAASEEQKRQQAKLKRLADELAQMQEAQEAAALKQELERTKKSKKLRLFGFFDLTFAKFFYDEKKIYRMFLPKYSSFMMSNINLYIDSQMTEQLKALVEFRYSFLPHGDEAEYSNSFKKPDGSYGDPIGEYVRRDTSVRDPFTTRDFDQHGVSIERVHLTYTPSQLLSVTAGRFLTPYGIWNVDHGSPVVVMARVPYFQLRELMPPAQTGIYVFGRYFVSDKVMLDYGATLTNGRGPIDTLVDLDENKGLGGKLRLTYETGRLTLSVGGYGYFGSYTDRSKGRLIDVAAGDVGFSSELLEQYDEAILATDVKIEYEGLLLQAENVFRRVSFDQTIPLEMGQSGAKDIDPMAEQHYAPSYVGWGLYGLLGYELPLTGWLGRLRIMPFLFVEYFSPNDSESYNKGVFISGGLNLKPSQHVVLKLQYDHVLNFNQKNSGDYAYSGLIAQMAVTY